MSPVTTVTLPAWVPLVNTALSFAALILAVILLVQVMRSPGVRVRVLRLALVFGAIGFVAAATVLMAGGLNQAGFLALEVWIAIGTGGRALLVAILALLVTTMIERGTQDD